MSFRRAPRCGGMALWAVAAVLVGLFLFLWRFDPAVVAPRNVDRLLATGGDPAMNALGWEYFRSEPWSWPPGRCRGYGAPFGSSIGLVDGVPLLGLPGKLIAGREAEPWQYFGIWLLASYLLQALAGWLLAGLVFSRNLPRILAAALFLLTPSFLNRTGHMALSGHWLVLLALYFYGRNCRRRTWLALAAVASLCHPYLAAMVLGVAAAAQLKDWRAERSPGLARAAVTLGAMLGLVLAGWWVSGMFVYGLGANDQVEGFGQFSANLNTLANPLGFSRWLPSLPLAHPGQVEGFNYLGLGLLPLWLLPLGWCLGWRRARALLEGHGPLLLVLGVMALFAASHQLTLGQRVLPAVGVPGFLHPVTHAFRASGRFLWPVTYAGTLFGFWCLARMVGPRLQGALLALLLLVQVLDLAPLLPRQQLFRQDRFVSRLQDPAWPQVMASTDRLLTVPLLNASTQFPYDFRDLDLPLLSRAVPTSAAYLTRSNAAAAGRWSADFLAGLAGGRRPDPGTTLVVRDTELLPYLQALWPDFVAHNLDGFRVFVARTVVLPGALAYAAPRPADLQDFLAAHAGDTLVLAVRDEGTQGLSPRSRAILGGRGLAVGDLSYRCSWAAVFSPAGVLWQEVSADHAVQGVVEGPRPLEVRSAGLAHGNLVSIRLDGVEQAVGRRGLNILALDEGWRPVALGLFDTFLGEAGWSLEFQDPAPAD